MSYYPAAVIINDTSTVTGRFGCIKALKDSEIATLVAENITAISQVLNLSLTALSKV